MEVGFASSIINPPLGSAMQGLSQEDGCTAIREDIAVRALALTHGEQRALVLSFDLVFFERHVVDRIKGQLARVLNLAPAEVLLNFTHNHAGPLTSVWTNCVPDPLYLEFVEQRTVETSCAAFRELVQTRVFAGTARTTLPVSRRKLDENGQAQWLPDPEGAVCDALPFCLFKSDDGVQALLYSVACHPSIWYESEICADYPGVATRLLNAHFNTDGALFLQGCGGDSKPNTVAKEAQWRPGEWRDVEDAGRSVADAVIAAATAATPAEQIDLRVMLDEIHFDLCPPASDAEFEQVLKDPNESQARRDWAQDELTRRAFFGRGQAHVPVALHALQIARGVRLIGLEAETLADIGNQILQRYNHGVTFALGYTDGTQVYLPSDRQLPERGYEVDSYWEYHLPAPLAPGINDRLDDHLKRLQRRIPNEAMSALEGT